MILSKVKKQTTLSECAKYVIDVEEKSQWIQKYHGEVGILIIRCGNSPDAAGPLVFPEHITRAMAAHRGRGVRAPGWASKHLQDRGAHTSFGIIPQKNKNIFPQLKQLTIVN